jgi:preprotein translocase subunit SecG
MGLIAMWIIITVVTFIGSVLVLDDHTSGFSDKERRVIGAIGLAAPLWPITAVMLLLWGIFFAGRYLFRAVRGVE